MLESALENKCRLWLRRKYGGRLVKWIAPGSKGVPDRIALIPFHPPLFIEFKQKRGRLESLQRRWSDWLQTHGFFIKTVRSFDDFIEVVEAHTEC